jgi:hypothetical protein
MTIWEAHKQQWNAMKNKSFKERLAYFCQYYGIQTVAILAAVAVVIGFIVNLVTKKDYAFTGVFFGAQLQASSDAYLQDFAQQANIDLTEYDMSIQTRLNIHMDQTLPQELYTSMEAFYAMVATGSVDCFTGELDLMLYYAYMEYATDLRTVLTAEELTALAPYLHYIDGALIAQQEADNGGLADAYAQRPDSTKPELMGDPIPVAVSLSAATDACKQAYQFGENAAICICASSEHSQNALAFLRYCFGLSL